MSSVVRQPVEGGPLENGLDERCLREFTKRSVRRILQAHIPVEGLGRPLFSALYHLHVGVRESMLFSARFLWYEPLFRSQCAVVGARFQMEQLPYLHGRGEIVIGDDVRLSGKPSLLFSSRHCARPKLLIGDGVFLGHNSALSIASRIEIGKHSLIASGVRIADFDGHPIDATQRRSGDFVAPDRVLPVIIGDDVWIGNGATVLKGVTIGDRTIIGARAIVTESIPADCIAVGNPAKVIKHLPSPSFDQQN